MTDWLVPAADVLAGVLGQALDWVGRRARGDLFLEDRGDVFLARAGGKALQPELRSGGGGSLRAWNADGIAFAAADGNPRSCLAAALSLLGAPALREEKRPAVPDGGRLPRPEQVFMDHPAEAGVMGSTAPGRGRKRAASTILQDPIDDAARFLAALEGKLVEAIPGVDLDLALAATRRRTVVLIDRGELRSMDWRWLRLRITARGDGGEARWACGAPALASLARGFPPEIVAPRLARRLAGASAASLPACEPRHHVAFMAGHGAVVLHELVHGLEADAALRGWSPWTAEPGKEQATSLSPLLTLWDDPTRSGLRGSYERDDEGMLAERTLLVRHGAIAGRLGDRMTGEAIPGVRAGNGRRSSWQEPPQPRAANLCLATGTDDREGITSGKGSVLAVHALEDAATDPLSGHVTLTVSEGEWFENGSLVGPVSGIVLEGDLIAILASVDRVCADRARDDGAATCGREGTGVPIGFYAPSFRARGLRAVGVAEGASR